MSESVWKQAASKRAIASYALFEHERRFLIAASPDLSDLPSRLIDDQYIFSTRMRLRAITHGEDQQAEFMLCKKYPTGNPFSRPIVNIYLTEAEFAVMAKLLGKGTRKRRYPLDFAAMTFALDVFQDHLPGLILCEVEAATEDDLQSIPTLS